MICPNCDGRIKKNGNKKKQGNRTYHKICSKYRNYFVVFFETKQTKPLARIRIKGHDHGMKNALSSTIFNNRHAAVLYRNLLLNV